MTFRKTETLKSLIALSVGDSTGENTLRILPADAYKAGNVSEKMGKENFWYWTDDTHLAIGLARVLFKKNKVDQLTLAVEFATNFDEDNQRGYGKGTHALLRRFKLEPENWKALSSGWWKAPDGTTSGSKGNGSAMRDSIIGAHFEDLNDVVINAELSAQVTHFHPEAIAGSIAVAVAANVCTYKNGDKYWETILACTPEGPIWKMIEKVSGMENDSAIDVISVVGNGFQVCALDTVPYALWLANQVRIGKLTFTGVMNLIVTFGGDTDTVAAIVGGIIGNISMPSEDEIQRTEPLPEDLFK